MQWGPYLKYDMWYYRMAISSGYLGFRIDWSLITFLNPDMCQDWSDEWHQANQSCAFKYVGLGPKLESF